MTPNWFVGWSRLILFCLIISFSCVVEAVTLYVTQASDFHQNRSVACSNESNLGCNLRTAWYECEAYYNSTDCVIFLPPFESLFVNSSLGGLFVSDTASITIVGNDANIFSLGDDIWTSSLIDVSGDFGRTELRIVNVSFWNFGASSVDGGLVSCTGYFDLTLEYVNVRNTTSSNGAVKVEAQTTTTMPTITIIDSLFEDNVANEGGGSVSLWYDVNVFISRTAFIRSSALGGWGGAIDSTYLSGNVRVESSVFEDCFADQDGSSMYLLRSTSALNGSFFLVNNQFRRTMAVPYYSPGGAVYFQNAVNSVVSGCSFSSITGQQSPLTMYLSHSLIVENSTWSDCSSPIGGAIKLEMSSKITIRQTNILRCVSTDFSGSAISHVQCRNVTIEDSFFDQNSSPAGGAIFYYNTSHASLKNTIVRRNVLEAVTVSSLSHDIYFYNFTAIDGAGTSGGGIRCFGGVNIVVDSCTFVNNTVSYYGGAIYIGQESAQIRILRSIFEQNSASIVSYGKGGAIYIASRVSDVIIAGCDINDNYASTTGGGLFVRDDSSYVALLDYEGYEQFRIVQTPHPYVSGYPVNGKPYVIFNETINVPSASGFVVVFDDLTNVFVTDTLYIYTFDSDDNAVQSYSSQDSGYPGKDSPPLFLLGTKIQFLMVGPSDGSSSLLDSYGFLAALYSIIADPSQPTIFRRNQAYERGGGMYMYFELNNLVLSNVHFLDNVAQTGDAGGLSTQLANVGLSMWQVLFEGNQAKGNGGGMQIANGNFALTMYNCTFRNNAAKARGGALYVVSGNGDGVYTSRSEDLVNVSHSQFMDNEAGSIGGGAIFADTSNIMQFTSTIFVNNSAGKGSGGAFLLNQYNLLSLVDCNLTENHAAVSGGAIYSLEQNSLSIQGARVIANVAGQAGGGLAATRTASVYFCGQNEFVANVANAAGGGAMLLSSMDFWQRTDYCDWTYLTLPPPPELILRENVAIRGSAALLNKVTFPVGNAGFEEINVWMMDNVASLGGTVYWVNDGAVMTAEPVGLQNLSVSGHAFNNVAGYGNLTATQAMYLSSPSSVVMDDYDAYLSPAVTVTAADFYHQVIPFIDTSTVQASVVGSGPTNCSGNYPYLMGPDTQGDGVTFTDGIAIFSELKVYCAPRGQISLQFEMVDGSLVAIIPQQSVESYYIRTNALMTFRSCTVGEYVATSICTACPAGSYNIDTVDASTCTKCVGIEGILTCYADTIVVSTGYWRRYPTNHAVLACNMQGNCVGQNATGDASCAVGYSGPLCGVCTDGYYLSENACRPCDGGTSGALPRNVLAALLLVICILLFSLACAFYRYVYVPPNILEKLAKENRSLSTMQLLYLWCKMKYHAFVVKFKIIAANIQIITSTANTFKVSWPSSFVGFNYSMGILNFNVGGIFSFGCSMQYDFFAKLVTVTLMPLGIVAALCLIFWIQFGWLRQQKRRERLQQQAQRNYDSRTRYRWKQGWDAQYDALRNTYLSYIFYLTYFILPMVTTTIFQAFLCVNVDPSGETPEEPSWYLAADMSISCETSYYYSWRAYAIIMVLVYPVGIPALYFWLLYQRRYEIKHREDALQDEHQPSDPSASTTESSSPKPTTPTEVNPMHSGEVTTASVATASSQIASPPSSPSSQSSPTRKASLNRSSGDERRSSGSAGNNNRSNSSSNTNGADGEPPKKKKKPKRPQQSGGGSHVGGLSPEAERLSFLWLAYAPRYWYWEIVETTRRLLLTAALSVISPGSSAQNVLSILLALLYVKLYGYFNPYADASDDVLAEIGQFQVFFTFFTALVVQNKLLNDSYNTLLGVLLILLNLTAIVVTFCHEMEAYQQDMQAAKAESQDDQVLVTAALRSRLSLSNKRNVLEVAPLRHVRRQPASKSSATKNEDQGDSDDEEEAEEPTAAKKARGEYDSDDEDDYDYDDDDVPYEPHQQFQQVFLSGELRAIERFQLAARLQQSQSPTRVEAPAATVASSKTPSHDSVRREMDMDIEMATVPSTRNASASSASTSASAPAPPPSAPMRRQWQVDSDSDDE